MKAMIQVDNQKNKKNFWRPRIHLVYVFKIENCYLKTFVKIRMG